MERRKRLGGLLLSCLFLGGLSSLHAQECTPYVEVQLWMLSGNFAQGYCTAPYAVSLQRSDSGGSANATANARNVQMSATAQSAAGNALGIASSAMTRDLFAVFGPPAGTPVAITFQLRFSGSVMGYGATAITVDVSNSSPIFEISDCSGAGGYGCPRGAGQFSVTHTRTFVVAAGEVYFLWAFLQSLTALGGETNTGSISYDFVLPSGTYLLTASGYVQGGPRLTSLVPGSAAAGGPSFTLTVNGENFAADSVVRWNGSDRPTTFLNNTQVRATISASDIASPGTAQVTASNPDPTGGLSNSLTFTITPPPPPNDSFVNAIEVMGRQFSNITNTSSATVETTDPFPTCGNRSRARSVWYRFTPPETAYITVDTFTSDVASNYDTLLSVFTGTPGAFTQVACNDNLSTGLLSRVRMTASAGTTYFLMVTSSSGAGGTLAFNVYVDPPPVGFVDEAFDPADGDTIVSRVSQLAVRGWAADFEAGAPVTRLEVQLLNAEPRVLRSALAQLGETRPDIRDAYNRQDFLNSGWSAVFTVGDLPLGPYTLRAVAVDWTGVSRVLGGQRNITLVNLPPFGWMDVVMDSLDGDSILKQNARMTVHGWAVDPDVLSPAPVSRVEVRIDGQAVGNGTLGVARPDIVNAYGRGDFMNSGWALTVSIGNLSLGAHTVTSVAYDADGGVTELGGSAMIFVVAADQPPFGWIDEAVDPDDGDTTVRQNGNLFVRGWAVDEEDAAPAARIEIRVDGVRVGDATLGAPRPDIASVFGRPGYLNSGWSFSFPVISLSLGTHTVSAVAFDSANNSAVLNGAVNISIVSANRAPIGWLDEAVDAADGDTTVEQNGSLTIRGWAADAEDGAPVTRVEIRLGSTVLGDALLGGARADIVAAYGREDYLNSGWSFTANLTALATGTYAITAMAYDSANIATTLSGTRNIIVTPPSERLLGWVDAAVNAADGGAMIPQDGVLLARGWAVDLDSGAPVSRVEVKIDGAAVGDATLGLARPDVRDALGRADALYSGWEFRGNVGVLAAGCHSVTAVAYGTAGLSRTLSGTQQVVIVSGDPAGTTLLWRWPLCPEDRGQVSQDYAQFGRIVASAYHAGLDIATPQPSAVVAVAAGRVVRIQLNDAGCMPPPDATGDCDDHGFGNTVIVEHDTQAGLLYSQYSHLAEIAVWVRQACGEVDPVTKSRTCTPGIPVRPGDLLGVSGGSGYGRPDFWSPHLHLAVKDFGTLETAREGFGYPTVPPDTLGYRDPIILLHSTIELGAAINAGVAGNELPVLRVGPGGAAGRSYRVVTQISGGTQLEIVRLAELTEDPDCAAGWLEVRKPGGESQRFTDITGGELREAWICADQISGVPLGFVDEVSLQGGSLMVRGWAADVEDGAPVTRVEVWIDGVLAGSAMLGITRADVRDAYGRPDFLSSGWTFSMILSELAPGPHRITAVAYDSSGLAVFLPPFYLVTLP